MKKTPLFAAVAVSLLSVFLAGAATNQPASANPPSNQAFHKIVPMPSFTLPFTNGQIHLQWNYDSNALAQADASATPFSFIVRGTNQIAAQPWPVISNQIWTNYPIVGYDGTNYTFYMPYQIVPEGVFYFEATASNFMWGESGFSNTSSTPSVAVPITIQIHPN